MVTLLDPLQEGGAVAAAAVTVLEQLVVHAKHLLGERLKTLPPLPQAVEGLGKHKQKGKSKKRNNYTFQHQCNERAMYSTGLPTGKHRLLHWEDAFIDARLDQRTLLMGLASC